MRPLGRNVDGCGERYIEAQGRFIPVFASDYSGRLCLILAMRSASERDR